MKILELDWRDGSGVLRKAKNLRRHLSQVRELQSFHVYTRFPFSNAAIGASFEIFWEDVVIKFCLELFCSLRVKEFDVHFQLPTGAGEISTADTTWHDPEVDPRDLMEYAMEVKALVTGS